jgi:hypothetical protein
MVFWGWLGCRLGEFLQLTRRLGVCFDAANDV